MPLGAKAVALFVAVVLSYILIFTVLCNDPGPRCTFVFFDIK